MCSEVIAGDKAMSDDIVERLQDIQQRFIFQGNSKFALTIASEIERLRAENAKLKSTDMAVAMTEMSLRDEIARLRARVEVLERVRGVAQSLINTASRLGWIAAATLRDDLRDALEDKP
jgi:uncharacterized small protein (DUF1192 family)